MEEVEYVVPPGAVVPSGAQMPSKPPKKPSNIFAWVKSHKIQSVAGLVMAVIIVLIGTVMMTGQQVSLYGFQLNPLYNEAACTPNVNGSLDVDCEIEPGPPPTNEEGMLDIVANFPAAAVGQPYNTTVETINAHGASCEFTLVTEPNIPSATLTVRANVAQTEETTAEFSATPQTAGNFVVAIRVTCGATAGYPTRQAAKDYNFTVNGISVSTPTTLGITGTFADGRVGQAYTASIRTTNAGNPNCTFSLLSVVPPVAGAKVITLPSATTAEGGIAIINETSGNFTATPQSVGTYKVKIAVSCDPITPGSDAPNRTAEKEFTWKVVANTPGGAGGAGGGSSGGGSGSSPTITYSCATPAHLSKLTPIYRYWNLPAGDHFFTTNANEIPVGYQSEGIIGYVFNVQVPGSVPIYRSYSPTSVAHYYSLSMNAVNYGYREEGVLGYAFTDPATGALPWYRLHKGYPLSDLLETTSLQEKNQAITVGYRDEGVVANICERNS